MRENSEIIMDEICEIEELFRTLNRTAKSTTDAEMLIKYIEAQDKLIQLQLNLIDKYLDVERKG